MNLYEFIYYMTTTTAIAVILGKTLKKSGEVPPGQEIPTGKNVSANADKCEFSNTCGCQGICYSKYCDAMNRGEKSKDALLKSKF